MDAVTKALIETIGTVGYVVSIEADASKNMVVTAVSQESGETFVVRALGLYLATGRPTCPTPTLSTAMCLPGSSRGPLHSHAGS